MRDTRYALDIGDTRDLHDARDPINARDTCDFHDVRDADAPQAVAFAEIHIYAKERITAIP